VNVEGSILRGGRLVGRKQKKQKNCKLKKAKKIVKSEKTKKRRGNPNLFVRYFLYREKSCTKIDFFLP
jgi:hypothetical protein